MIPQLLGSTTCNSVDVNQLVPPQGFRPVTAQVSGVTMSQQGFARANASSAAQRAGLRYEDLVQEHLASVFPDYLRSPWLRFTEHTEFGDDKRACVPDGLLLRDEIALVFEIKIRHTTDAWFQLRRLYFPVVSALAPTRSVYLVEICSLFDPAVMNPESIVRVLDIERFAESPWGNYGVFVWTR